jgi:Holliday junction resolvase RusA-like endonuclease
VSENEGAGQPFEIAFTVPGVAQSAGSKNAFPIKNKRTGDYLRDKRGNIVINVVDSNKNAASWKRDIARVVRSKFNRDLLDGPLRATFRFYFPRPNSHYVNGDRTRPLKKNAPKHITKAPDVLKLTRCAEDAMNKVLYVDDSQIVEENLRKYYGEPARIEVIIRTLSNEIEPVEEVLFQ